jgi:hypothetical protein
MAKAAFGGLTWLYLTVDELEHLVEAPIVLSRLNDVELGKGKVSRGADLEGRRLESETRFSCERGFEVMRQGRLLNRSISLSMSSPRRNEFLVGINICFVNLSINGA